MLSACLRAGDSVFEPRAGNQKFFESLAQEAVSWPPMVLAITGHVDWASRGSVRKAVEALQGAQELWAEARTTVQLQNFAVLFRKETRRRYFNGLRRAST